MWEWCWDRYGSNTSGSQTDPRGPTSGTNRVIRGGSWINYADYCRAAYRDYSLPDYANYYGGFRTARSSVP
jgi:formylglycine-generating enzyme required for sulfatase activity